MKKFAKICLIMSAVLVLIGGTICVLGAVSGGWRLVNEMDGSGSFWRVMHRMGHAHASDETENIRADIEEVKEEVRDSLNEARDEAESDAWDEIEDIRTEISDEIGDAKEDINEIIGEEFRTAAPGGDADTGIAASQITDMKIDIGGASLCFMESENDNFGVKIDGKGEYKYYESGSVFYLEGKRDHIIGENNEKVYLYIPKGKTFNEVEINVGGGLISIEELDAQEVDMTAGAGLISCNRISCRELDIEVGAGEAILDGIEADKMDIEVGMGSVYMKGRITREIDAKCGMGFLGMELDNAETDFNYEVECAAGGITIGDKNYSALSNEVQVNNRASGECSLDCSMGSIEVAFTR